MTHTATVARQSRFALLALAVVLSLGLLVGLQSAQAATLNLAGGYTQLTTDPGTTKALVANRIVPLPVYPSWVTPTWTSQGLALRYRFYITGGSIDSATLAGQINHSGGLKFVNYRNGKSLKATNFVIDTTKSQLWGTVGGGSVPLLDLDLSGYTVTAGSVYTVIAPVPAKLTPEAAGALNATLGTTIFTPGLSFGTAKVSARF
jgi:hypothetical protein